MNGKLSAAVMGALTLIYVLLLSNTGFTLLAIEKLSKQIETDGTWPELKFEFRPSGRATKESAAIVFAEYAKKVAADADNYLNWFALGLAYDAAGDRRRARASMRRALKLSRG
jgi:cytochrome c-type biogenesis protein CcmH/NrfG